MQIENYFEDKRGIGVIGQGETIDLCFSQIASNMFALMQNVEQIHLMQIITFEFTEENTDKALPMWLTLLLEKSHEHQLMFGDFRLKHETGIWKATVSGERARADIKRELEVKRIFPASCSMSKIEHRWEARCVVDILK